MGRVCPLSLGYWTAGRDRQLQWPRPWGCCRRRDDPEPIGCSYDWRSRFTQVIANMRCFHGYDPVGNRLTEESTAYSYDRADRITAAGVTSHTVDANGNLTARGSDAFTYDGANRLRTAKVGRANGAFVYDGDGKRTSKTVTLFSSTTSSYLYDVNASLPVLLEDGARKYVWGLGLAYAVDQAGNPIVYHADGLGSIRALSDSTGSVVQTYETDEFGVITSASGTIE